MPIITLAEIKAALGIHGITNDAMINVLIPIVQDQIQNFLDRDLDTKIYYEWHPYSYDLILDQYPIQSITFIGGLQKMATFTPIDGYGFQINSAYQTTNVNSGLTVTKYSDFSTHTFPFSSATHLEELQTQVEAYYSDITLTIDTGYEMVNWRLLKPGTGRDIYGAKQTDCITTITDNRTVNLLQDAGFLFLSTNDICSDVQIYVQYQAGYATADMPGAIKLVAANVIKNIVNISTAGQGTPGARSGLYNQENWQPDSHSYNYQVSDIAQLEIAKQVSRYEKELFGFKKKSV